MKNENNLRDFVCAFVLSFAKEIESEIWKGSERERESGRTKERERINVQYAHRILIKPSWYTNIYIFYRHKSDYILLLLIYVCICLCVYLWVCVCEFVCDFMKIPRLFVNDFQLLFNGHCHI